MPSLIESMNTAVLIDLKERLRAAMRAGDDRQAAGLQAKIEARIRIEKRRNERRERQGETRSHKEKWEARRTSAPPRHSPQRQAPAGRWQDRYTAAEFERQFGYPPPDPEDNPAPPPAPGDDGIPF